MTPLKNPTITPFEGIRFNPNRFSLDRLLTPSFDIMGERDQKRYYTHRRVNIRNFWTSQIAAKDSDNPFPLVNLLFRRYLDKNDLIRDPKPAYYLCEQTFRHKDFAEPYKRISVIASVLLDGHVYPHEKTFASPVGTRKDILTDFPVQLDPVMSVINRKETAFREIWNKTDSQSYEVSINANNLHQFKVIDDPKEIAQLTEILADAQVFIADGHHRYESTQAMGFPGMMMMLICEDDPGLMVFPTHRLLRTFKDQSAEKLLEFCKSSFKYRDTVSTKDIDLEGDLPIEEGDGLFAICASDALNKFEIPSSLKVKGDEFDVEIIREKIIEGFLSFDKGDFEENLAFTESRREAIRLTMEGKFKTSILLSPLPFQKIKSIALKGETLPPKATYFFPKPLAGFVFQSFMDL